MNSHIIKILKTIRKISSQIGEGAAIIFVKENKSKNIFKFIAPMELQVNVPGWLKTLSLDDPQYLIRAAFIMDGACLILKRNCKITSRLAIYPFCNGRAWGIDRIIDCKKNIRSKMVKKLTGKGSRTHLCANLTTLKCLNSDLLNPEVFIISISADGPIKIWPQEITRQSKNNE